MGLHQPRPTALGILLLSSYATEQHRLTSRLTIAERANEEGYALLETFEVSGHRGRDEAVYQAVERVAEEAEAQAFFVAGKVNLPLINEIADRVRLLVLQVEECCPNRLP